MSNVLIGVIGVILFIGLALAGALFLGPRFQEARAQSIAATMIQQASQVSFARSLFMTREGMEPSTYTASALAPQYLKSTPINPMGSNFTYNALDIDGNWPGELGSKKPSYVVIAGIGGEAGDVERICAAINKQSGNGEAPLHIGSMSDIRSQIGCVSPTKMIGVAGPGFYVISKI